MKLKYNARKISEIEEKYNIPIENCVQNFKMEKIVTFVQKGLVSEVNPVTEEMAYNAIDEYLKKSDKNNLVMDIMEDQ